MGKKKEREEMVSSSASSNKEPLLAGISKDVEAPPSSARENGENADTGSVAVAVCALVVAVPALVGS